MALFETIVLSKRFIIVLYDMVPNPNLSTLTLRCFMFKYNFTSTCNQCYIKLNRFLKMHEAMLGYRLMGREGNSSLEVILSGYP